MSSLLQRESRWTVGNDKSISLWFDNWIDNISIASKVPCIQFSEYDSVVDLIFEDAWLIPIQLPVVLQDFLSNATNLIQISETSTPDSILAREFIWQVISYSSLESPKIY
eukprot:TRINITY_DN10201_c1_g1_i1.p2 TRINITY_DN10201_c1_g1~~TRINITY_DN10201_c1_g1_i1.p2  ORF type:complete len:110 (-),score=12.25 TRINITY_DN10201_c1_g1_i1:67-396(-)